MNLSEDDYKQLFDEMHPHFFEASYIRERPEDDTCFELILELKKESPAKIEANVPSHITFGVYSGDLKKLHAAIEVVDKDWVQYFTEDRRAFCAFDGDKIAAFCLLEDWGVHKGLRIGGPGCVGTVPDYRKQGIGLEMVRLATELVQKEGFDISWIHYTHLVNWYSRLGYHTILKWGCKGWK